MISKRTTMHDIAKKLGVSTTTVGLALKNSPRVSIQRRRKIQQVARAMEYRPDPALARLAVYRWNKPQSSYHGTIAWLRHWGMEDQRMKFKYHEQIWRGTSQMAGRLGYRVEPVCWEPDFSARRLEQILVARGIQGILIPPHRPAPDWHEFAWDRFSVVRFGLSVPFPDANLVTPDSFRGMVTAVRRIHEYGYRRIGLVVGEFDVGIGGNFCGGFLSACYYLDLKLKIPPLISNSTEYQRNAKRENQAFRNWLERYRPDAIIINEAHVISQLNELGYRIPEDIAVAATSVHDMPIDAGMEQDAVAVGSVAVETLVKQINFNERGEPEHPCRILVESKWQDGSSLPGIS